MLSSFLSIDFRSVNLRKGNIIVSHVWFHLGIRLLCLSSILAASKPNIYVRADETTQREQIKQQIAQLIDKLDSNQRAVRQRAEIQLVALGKPVLSLLPPPELLSSNSVRDALQRVRLQIEKQAAKNSIKATVVNLKGRFSFKEVINEITKQTENPIDITNLPEPALNTMIEVDYHNEPFWKTIDELAQKQSFTYQFNDSNGALQLLQSRNNKQHLSSEKNLVCYNGPFRIVIRDLLRRPVVGSVNRELLRATFLIQAEPRLRPLFLNYASSEIQAVTKSNRSLPPFNPYAKYELPLGEGGKGLQFTVEWIVNSTQIPKTIQLEGRLKMELAAETLPITFDHLVQSQGAIRRRGNISVELVKAEKIQRDNTEGLNIRIALSYDYGGPAFESHRTWIYHNRAYLEDPQGRKYWLNGSSETTLQNAGKTSVLYRFKGLPPKQEHYQFTYLAPTLITFAPIEFRFEKVPFPEKNSSLD